MKQKCTLWLKTDLYKSTVYRFLSSMTAQGYVCKDECSSQYRMSTKLYALSSQVVEHLYFVQIMRHPMEALHHVVHETIHLVIPEGTILSISRKLR